MKKRIAKKSEVLREGYIKGLKKAQTIIDKMITEGYDDSYLPFKVHIEYADDDYDAALQAEEMTQHRIEYFDAVQHRDGSWTLKNIIWGEPFED